MGYLLLIFSIFLFCICFLYAAIVIYAFKKRSDKTGEELEEASKSFIASLESQLGVGFRFSIFVMMYASYLVIGAQPLPFWYALPPILFSAIFLFGGIASEILWLQRRSQTQYYFGFLLTQPILIAVYLIYLMVTLSWLSTTPAPLLPLLLLYAAVSALILGVVMYGLRKLVFPKEAFDHAHEVAAIYIEIHESEGDTTKLFDKLGLISDKYQYYKWKEIEQQGKKIAARRIKRRGEEIPLFLADSF